MSILFYFGLFGNGVLFFLYVRNSYVLFLLVSVFETYWIRVQTSHLHLCEVKV